MVYLFAEIGSISFWPKTMDYNIMQQAIINICMSNKH